MKKEPTVTDAILELAKTINDWNVYWSQHDNRIIRIVIVKSSEE